MLSVSVKQDPELTELGGQLDDLSDGSNTSILNEILMTNDGFRNTFRKILGSAVSGD
jgi:hypothetical protein